MSGFQKKAAKSKVPEIPGTKQSIKTFSLLTPSGTPSLDTLTGGGFPIGTIIVTNASNEEARGYSKVVLNHFLGQGLTHYGHDVFMASGLNRKTEKISLMQPKQEERMSTDTKAEMDPQNETDLKIAWRYKDVKGKISLDDNESCPKTVKSSHVEGKFRQWVPTDSPIDFSTDDLYKSLFRDLRVAAESYELSSPANGNPPNILRVGLSDMDSALMAGADSDQMPDSLARFIFALKSLARHKLLVVCVTLALSDEEDRVSDKTRLMELSDFWFDLKAVPRDEKQSVSSQQRHHGIFTVSKLPNLKTLKCPVASSLGRYHFKSTKSKFVLEKIHLPPAEFDQPPTVIDPAGGTPKPSLHQVGNDW